MVVILCGLSFNRHCMCQSLNRLYMFFFLYMFLVHFVVQILMANASHTHIQWFVSETIGNCVCFVIFSKCNLGIFIIFWCLIHIFFPLYFFFVLFNSLRSAYVHILIFFLFISFLLCVVLCCCVMFDRSKAESQLHVVPKLLCWGVTYLGERTKVCIPTSLCFRNLPLRMN